MEGFAENVRAFVTLQDRIKEETKRQRESMKPHKDRLTAMSSELQDYMRAHDINEVQFGDEKLELVQTEKPVNPTGKLLESIVRTMFEDGGPASGFDPDEAIAHIREMAGTKNVVSIKRRKQRAKAKAGAVSTPGAAFTRQAPGTVPAIEQARPDDDDDDDDFSASDDE